MTCHSKNTRGNARTTRSSPLHTINSTNILFTF
nr:MAG TPA: hypothetical protein [Caudoviricetes sp.]